MDTLTLKTNTELSPLLTKLAELAPDVCLYEQEQGNHYRFRLNSLNHTIDLVDGQDISAIDYAALQWAIQGAISDRDWFWESVMNDTNEYESDVTDPYTLDPDGYPGINHVAEAENPAIALLTAYLQAVEATV